MTAALVHTLPVKGETLLVRPILPDDAQALRDLIRKADPKDVRSRFHAAVRELPESWITRLTHIDPEREMAFAGFIGEELLSVARLVCDPGCESGEFALAVRSDHQKRGIGRGMMGLLLDYARDKGLKRVWGAIELANENMLALARYLGFRAEGPPEQGEVRMVLDL